MDLANNSASSYVYKCVILIEANSLRPWNRRNPGFTPPTTYPSAYPITCPATS